MKTSEFTDKVSEALAAAQGEMRNPEKNQTAKIPTKTGGSYSYTYADLPATIEAIRAPLAKYGLAHTAGVTGSDAGMLLTVRLSHTSGQWLESSIGLPPVTDPKSAAANLTYFRRYLLSGLVGIAADEDLDSEPESPGAKYVPKGPAREPNRIEPSAALKVKPAEKVAPKAKVAPAPKAEAESASPLEYVPSVGKWTGRRLGEFSTAELETYAAMLTSSLSEQGKSYTELPPAHRELYEKLMAATAASFEKAIGDNVR